MGRVELTARLRVRSGARLLADAAGAERAPQTPERYPSMDVLPPMGEIRGMLHLGAPTFQRMVFEIWREQWPKNWLVVTRQQPLFTTHLRALSVKRSLPQAFLGELVPLSLMAYVAFCRGGVDAKPVRSRAVSYLGVDDSWLQALELDLASEEFLGPLPDQARLLPWLATSGVDWPSVLGPSCAELVFGQKRGLSMYQVSKLLLKRDSSERRRLWNKFKRSLRNLERDSRPSR